MKPWQLRGWHLRVADADVLRCPESTHRKSDWMGSVQCGDCCEARRVMGSINRLSTEDCRPGRWQSR